MVTSYFYLATSTVKNSYSKIIAMLNTIIMLFTLNMSPTVISKRVKFSSVRNEKVTKKTFTGVSAFSILESFLIAWWKWWW